MVRTGIRPARPGVARLAAALLGSLAIACGSDSAPEPAQPPPADVSPDVPDALPGEDAPSDAGTPLEIAPEDTDGGHDAEDVEGGLPVGVFELSGFDPTLPLDDLAPLGAVIGDAQVVALGESIHTSRGYYQAKHRVFRYLVEVEGFRVLAFESYWTSAEQVAAYVDTCEGDPVELVKSSLIYSWAGQSVADLIEWMCGYNQAHPDDPVQFAGFDIQQPWHDGPKLAAFLNEVAPEVAAGFTEGIARCWCGATSSYDDCAVWKAGQSGLDEADHAACMAALDGAESWLSEHETAVLGASSEEDLKWATLRLVGLRANQRKTYHGLAGEWGAMYAARDEGMAYAFNRIRELRFPGAKVAIWAHNWHIAYGTDLMTKPDLPDLAVPLGSNASPGMGTLLRAQLGEEYFAIGLHAHQVSVNWQGLHIGDLPAASDSSLEGILHQLGLPMLLVDLSAAPGGTLLESGASYPASVFDNINVEVPIVPAEQYGAVIFLDASPMMDALLW